MNGNIVFSKNQKINFFYYLVIYLLVYSFIGWLLETAYAFTELGKFVKRGFLYGPICPIYGWGAIILINFLDKYKKNSIKMFIVSSVIFSLFEYLVSFGLQALFSAKWWDYSDQFFNLNGRISIFFSFVWGIFGILFINHIHPFVKKHVYKALNKIPNLVRINLVRITFLLYIIDTVFSFAKNL